MIVRAQYPEGLMFETFEADSISDIKKMIRRDLHSHTKKWLYQEVDADGDAMSDNVKFKDL